MADATIYQKLERDPDEASEQGQDDELLSGARRPSQQKVYGWLRLLGEAVLVLAVIALGVKAMSSAPNGRRGDNDPRKNCQYRPWANEGWIANPQISRLRGQGVHERH